MLMFTAGIVAEFDPFHKGHRYLLEQARSRGATHIAVVMSGAAVQRGEPAVCSKHERAEIAVRCGADLVCELPAPYSCSAAGFFAAGAVQILGQLGIDVLCFGSETEDKESILSAARAMDGLEDSDAVKKRMEKGMSYPAAIQAAMSELYGEETAKAVSTPNSTLGTEYVRALAGNGISAEVMPIKRKGAGHGESDDRQTGFLSGSRLREMISDGLDIGGFLPEGCLPGRLCDPSAADDILLYRLLTAGKEELLRLPEVNGPLADRIIKIRRDPPDSLTDFLAEVKTANITHARLRRSALHLALGIAREDFLPPPYVRVLAFSRRGTEIMSRAKPSVPMSTSLRALEDSSEQAAHIIGIENRAVRLREICLKAPARFGNEYTKKIVIRK